MSIEGARGGWMAALLAVGTALTGCGGDDPGPGRPSSDGRDVADGLATSVPPDGEPPGSNFTFTVGETYLRNSAAPPSYVAYLETFFGGVLAPLQALDGLLPDTVSVIYDECGTANSFHDAGTGTITLCHELAQYAYDRYGSAQVPGPADPALQQDYAYSAMAFVLYHEIGHALDHQRNLPIAGNIESAVDSIATVIAVETKKAKYALAGAELFLDTPVSLAGRHGGGPDRAGDIYCWAIGGDLPTRELAAFNGGFSELVEDAGRDCVGEYAGQQDTVRAWVPNLARLQGVGVGAGVTGTGSFRFGFGETWLEGEGADPATRNKVAEVFTDALLPLDEAVGELAAPVSVIYDKCGRAESSWDASTRTVTICAELLAYHYDEFLQRGELIDRLDSSETVAIIQSVYQAASYLVYHEAGHALYDDGIIPATEEVEVAGDTLAAVLMVESGRGLFAAFAAVFLDAQPPAQAAVHGDVGLRGKELACWVLGGDSSVRVMPEFAEAASIYVEQGRDCPAEYAERRDTVRGWLGGPAGE